MQQNFNLSVRMLTHDRKQALYTKKLDCQADRKKIKTSIPKYQFFSGALFVFIKFLTSLCLFLLRCFILRFSIPNS